MELEGIQFQIEGLSGGSGAGGEIRDIASALGALKSSLPSEGRIKSVVGSLRKLAAVSRALKFDTTSISELGKALSDISGAKVSKTVGDGIRNIGESVRTITDADVARLRELSDALNGLKGIGNVQIKFSTPSGNNAADNVTPDGTQTQDASDADQTAVATRGVDQAISQANTSARGFFSTLQSGFATGVKGAFQLSAGFLKLGAMATGNLMKLPALFGKQLAGSIASATGKLGGLIAGLKRIAMYRAMRTVIKMITEGFTTGLKNVYEYSRLVGTQFASSMDQIATSSLYLKNSLGAMAAPLLQILAPAIDFVIDKFVSLLNVINMFIARLTGASVATIAKKTFAPWGDSADSAAGKTKKAVKEIRRTLLGFDEINRLDAPDKDTGGSGGTSGAGGADYGSMFEQVPIAKNISDFADKVKELFKAGKWEELGTFLGQKFNEIVEMIPWSELGRKVGYGVNGVITTAYHFLKEADFIKLGGKFAAFLNNALSEIDTETLGRLIVRKFTVLPEILIGAITKVNWGLVAEKASDFVIGIFDEAAEWLQEIDWGKLTETLFDNLVLFLKKVKWSKIGTSIAKFLGSAMGAIASVGITIWEKLSEGFAKAAKKAKDWAKDHIVKPFKKGFKEGGVVKGIWEAAKSVFKSLGDGFKKAVKKIWQVICKPFADAFGKTFKPAGKVGKKMKEAGKDILENIGKGIQSIINGDFFKWVKDTLFGGDDAEDDKDLASINLGVGLEKDGWESIKEWWKGLGDAIKLPDPIQVGVQLFKDGWKTITEWLFGKDTPSGHSSTSHNIELNATVKDNSEKGTISNLKSAWTTITGSPKPTLTGAVKDSSKSGAITDLKSAWTTITGSPKPTMKGKVENNSKSGAISTLKGAWTTIKGDPKPTMKGKVENNSKSGVIGTLKSAWETIKGKPTPKLTGTVVNNSKSGVISTLKSAWSNIPDGTRKSKIEATVVNKSKAKVIKTLSDILDKIKNARDKWITVTTTYKTSGSKKKPTGTNDRKDGPVYGPAVGGVYSSGHFRYSIPQYAAGGLPNHGTMFVAGEAGAEIVGHINGRTEVLNASQIASAIHSAVLSAMQQANNGQSPILNVTVRTENNEVLARAVTRGQRSLDARLNPTAAY